MTMILLNEEILDVLNLDLAGGDTVEVIFVSLQYLRMEWLLVNKFVIYVKNIQYIIAVLTMKTEEQKINYLTKLFEEMYLKDIIERHHIEKSQELEGLVNVLASAIASLTNVPKIEATFKNVIKSNVSANTIRQYIEYLENAFVINKANCYNVKGRKYIGTPLKYYFEDVGLRNARLGFRQIEEKRMQEKASLVNINDSFKKIILVKDAMNVMRDEDGITTMSIYDFLLKKNCL